VYEPSAAGLTITIPERRYELIAEILADAVAAEPADAREAAVRLARERGRQIGARLPEEGGDLVAAIDALGFEPRRERDGALVLRNCPFRVLAVRQTELVCGLNHALLTGLLDGLGAGRLGIVAELAPGPGRCCVTLR
jgi:predicted ArsR family transcriptional regulator